MKSIKHFIETLWTLRNTYIPLSNSGNSPKTCNNLESVYLKQTNKYTKQLNINKNKKL